MSESKPGSCNKTVTKNIKRVKEAKRVANELNLQIRQLKQKSNEKGGKAVKGEIIREEILSDAMTEVKLALDALRKSFKVLLLQKVLFLFPSFFNINLFYMFKIIQIVKNWNDTCVQRLEISH